MTYSSDTDIFDVTARISATKVCVHQYMYMYIYTCVCTVNNGIHAE